MNNAVAMNEHGDKKTDLSGLVSIHIEIWGQRSTEMGGVVVLSEREAGLVTGTHFGRGHEITCP